jgi:hypothetical protein
MKHMRLISFEILNVVMCAINFLARFLARAAGRSRTCGRSHNKDMDIPKSPLEGMGTSINVGRGLAKRPRCSHNNMQARPRVISAQATNRQHQTRVNKSCSLVKSANNMPKA